MEELYGAVEKSNNMVLDSEKVNKTLVKYQYWNSSARKLMEQIF